MEDNGGQCTLSKLINEQTPVKHWKHQHVSIKLKVLLCNKLLFLGEICVLRKRHTAPHKNHLFKLVTLIFLFVNKMSHGECCRKPGQLIPIFPVHMLS